jgi:hypothetical protein
MMTDHEDQERSSQELPASVSAPPATFEFLVQTLFTQALMACGRIPNPITKQSCRNLDTARHFIDMLEMVGKKTNGNLDRDEERLLEEMLHQSRMMYMAELAGGTSGGVEA